MLHDEYNNYVRNAYIFFSPKCEHTKAHMGTAITELYCLDFFLFGLALVSACLALVSASHFVNKGYRSKLLNYVIFGDHNLLFELPKLTTEKGPPPLIVYSAPFVYKM